MLKLSPIPNTGSAGAEFALHILLEHRFNSAGRGRHCRHTSLCPAGTNHNPHASSYLANCTFLLQKTSICIRSSQITGKMD